MANQKDMPDVYRNLDVVVLTSLWEGWEDYDLYRGIYIKSCFRALLDAAHAEGRAAIGNRGPSGRAPQDSRRFGSLFGRGCGLFGISARRRSVVGFQPRDPGTPAVGQYRAHGWVD